MLELDFRLTKRLYHAGKRWYPFWVLLSAHGIYGFIFFFFGFWIAAAFSGRVLGILFLSIGVTLAVTFFLRYVIRRPRPHFPNARYVPLLRAFSFPSAHASAAFALATIISLLLLELFVHPASIAGSVFLLLMAMLIALSRIMVGVHYVSDVLAGALLGVGISVLMLTLL